SSFHCHEITETTQEERQVLSAKHRSEKQTMKRDARQYQGQDGVLGNTFSMSAVALSKQSTVYLPAISRHQAKMEKSTHSS
ncbi:hypothetical protein BgiBS90_013173, partial [Biomphalaria glabrata]